MTTIFKSGLASLVSMLVVSGLVLAVSQHQVYALEAGQDIVCGVFDELNESWSGFAIVADGMCPTGSLEVPTEAYPECTDAIDNDGDGLIDYADVEGDPGCSDMFDADESSDICRSGHVWDGPRMSCIPESRSSDELSCIDGGGVWDAKLNTGSGACVFDLVITNQGPGTAVFGKVSSTSSIHASGTVVMLSGIPDAYAMFRAFSGDCAGTETCELVIDSPKAVTATFMCDAGYWLSQHNECVRETYYDNYSQAAYGEGAQHVAGSAPTAPKIPMSPMPPLSPAAQGESCDAYITDYLKFGDDNDPEQVRRLQHVLKTFEGAAVAETGIFDDATLAAVVAFQDKYASEILEPWDIEEPTGFVYLTTRKKLNDIVCEPRVSPPLSAEEQGVIEQSVALRQSGFDAEVTVPTDGALEQSEDDAAAENDVTDAVSPVRTPWQSIGNFLRWIFGL